jgi:hypothetical protein
MKRKSLAIWMHAALKLMENNCGLLIELADKLISEAPGAK